MAHRYRSWEDYYLPGTTTLRNKFHETDPAKLALKEQFATKLRLDELAHRPIPGRFDYEHMKAIHRHIFQDVYDWAGEERVGPVGKMTKDGPDVVNYAPGDPAAPVVAYGYFPAAAINDAAEQQYRLLAAENHLTGHPRDKFIDRLAEHWGEINTIHSFREGNTRSQFVFFTQLAANAGYELDPRPFTHDGPLAAEFAAARFYDQATGHADRLAHVLDQAIYPLELHHEQHFQLDIDDELEL